MRKVYLFCSAGMSTSMLTNKMQEFADKHNLPIEVKPFPLNRLDDVYSKEHPDCILLGPQVKFLFKETFDKYGKDVAVGIIDSADYGMMNGEGVLRSAIKMIKEKESERKGEQDG